MINRYVTAHLTDLTIPNNNKNDNNKHCTNTIHILVIKIVVIIVLYCGYMNNNIYINLSK